MSEPTNVTSSTKVMDSGSTLVPKSIDSSGVVIQGYSWVVMTRSSAGSPRSWIAMVAPSRKLRTGARTPSQWPHESERRPATSRTAAEASGMATSSQASDAAPVAGMAPTASSGAVWIEASIFPSPSVLQQGDVVEGRRPAGSVNGHDDREPHHDFGGGDDHDEERHDLTVQVAVHAGEGDQAEVGGVEHQFHAHEGDDRVAPDEHGGAADREQDHGEHQVVGEAHRSSSPWVSCGAGSPGMFGSPDWPVGRSRSAAMLGAKSPISSCWPRTRRTRGTDAMTGSPVAESAGMSAPLWVAYLSLIHISEPTRLGMISYAVFCLKKKKN